MHANEYVATSEQVERLIAAQLPHWAGLAVSRVEEFGTDHCLFRLGEDLVARMPRVEGSVEQVDTDARWLPMLATHGEGFPWRWSVVPWLTGTTPTAYDETNRALADDLAAFVGALRRAPTGGGPVKRPGMRGAPLSHWDEAVRESIVACGDRIDRAAVTAAWEDCVGAPTWEAAPVWIHGDLMVGNLLVDDGRLTGVIDFGALGLGDPAPDLLPAWCVLPPSARDRFRDLVGHDDATWRRSRGWALGPALTGIPYYWDNVPGFAERGLRTIQVVLDDLAAR